MGGSRWGSYTHANNSPEWIGVDENVRDAECSVCMEAFADWLPSPDDNSRVQGGAGSFCLPSTCGVQAV